ncbi:MAG TPA: TIGR03668 family PPOX class F420-dependent oxidoreductase [Solirubrobacteraceae bacterium]
MDSDAARALVAGARVARLATTGLDGRPHVVPLTFALLGDGRIVSAVDHKPKRTSALRRLANIAADPRVALLADHYEEDWSQLWWARADGTARVVALDADRALAAQALGALAARYPAYAERPPQGPLVVIAVERWSGWRAA